MTPSTVSPTLLRALALTCLLVLLASLTTAAQGQPAVANAPVAIAPIPAEVASTHFTVTVNGQTTPVLHAATGYYLLNFDLGGPANITVTSDDPHFWDAGVEVQPMRLGIRPERHGASIRFPLAGPGKISITRPGDFGSGAQMLFLFANPPDHTGYTASTPGIRFYGPGIHHENIDAHSGDRIYLADGAVIYGSLNLWGVHDVDVSGRGTLIYDGPQDPTTDEGWMHKPNWHVIVMDNASRIHIEGITGIVRSRTWMVQMRDSRDITFRNVKIIGGSASNANQDGMDWLGGGDTLVQDSFIRAADDVFAMQGNWDGYSAEAMATPGHLVSNVTVEGSVLSTSISNIVRLGWPRKTFDSHGFTLRDSDVIHMGFGACGIPFALFEIWADPDGHGQHTGIHLEDIRLDHWYSLLQIEQPNPSVEDVSLQDIWSMDDPGMVGSTLKGQVSGVTLTGVDVGAGVVSSNSEVPLAVTDGATQPTYAPGTLTPSFTYSRGFLKPGKKIRFEAPKQPGVTYRWLFGDGGTATGRKVRHAFPDSDGTLLDGSGRFRVLLSATSTTGQHAWTSQSVIVGNSLQPPTLNPAPSPGAADAPQPGTSTEYLDIPADGGYTVWLLTSTRASLTLDGHRVGSGKPESQVCGSPGNAVQALRVSLALAKGKHTLVVQRDTTADNATPPGAVDTNPVLLWEGPGIRREKIPAASLSQ